MQKIRPKLGDTDRLNKYRTAKKWLLRKLVNSTLTVLLRLKFDNPDNMPNDQSECKRETREDSPASSRDTGRCYKHLGEQDLTS